MIQFDGFTAVPDVLLQNKDLTLSGAVVYGRVARYCQRSGICWAAAPTIADEVGLNERTVREKLIALVALGYLTVEKRPGTSNQYRITDKIHFTLSMGEGPEKSSGVDRKETPDPQEETPDEESIKREHEEIDDFSDLFPKDDPAPDPVPIPVAVDSLVKGSDKWKAAKRKALGGSAVGMMAKISAEHHKLIDEDTTRGGRLLRVWLDSKGIDVHRVPQKRKEDDAEMLVGMVADLGISDDDAVSVLRTLLDPEGDNGWKATNVYKNVYTPSLAADYAVAALTHLSQNGKGRVVLLDKKKKSGIHIVL